MIVPPSWEGDRNNLALEASRLHPDRFAVMGRPPAVPRTLAHWRDQQGMLGLRVTSNTAEARALFDEPAAGCGMRRIVPGSRSWSRHRACCRRSTASPDIILNSSSSSTIWRYCGQRTTRRLMICQGCCVWRDCPMSLSKPRHCRPIRATIIPITICTLTCAACSTPSARVGCFGAPI